MSGDGLTIAASEARHISQIARRTVISDDALSVHGYMLTALGQGAWMVGVGLLLWRGWSPDPAT